MRAVLLGFLLAAGAAPAFAQAPTQAPGAPPPNVLFASNADALALLAKAKAELKAGTAMAPPQPLVRAGAFRAVVEHRAASTPASVHDRDGEFIQVIAGGGSFILGGALTDERRTNATNRTGTGITGGETRTLKPGDVVFVPAGAPHFFATVGPEGLGIITHRVPPPAP